MEDQKLPDPKNCVEFINDDGRRFAWSESNVCYEEVPQDGESFTLLRKRLSEAEAERDRLQAKLDCNKCNAGHETLPLALWDCPECVRLKMDALAKERDEWAKEAEISEGARKRLYDGTLEDQKRLALVDAVAVIADKILEHKDSGSDVDYHLEEELVELERALDAYRAGEAKPILPEDIMEKYLAEARKSTMFGYPLDELSREELMATIGLLGWDLQGERTSHMNSIEMFRLLGGR